MVPLTIPLLTGPASMSTVVIYADRAQTFWQHARAGGLRRGHCLATAVCFSLADPIARVLGKTGINVMTRLMGLIPAALAVEVMADGLGKIFPVHCALTAHVHPPAAARRRPRHRRTVAYALERDGLQVTHCLLVQDARQQMQRQPFDLLVLDVGRPMAMDWTCCAIVRHGQTGRPIAAAPATPVLMLSARGEELDRVLGLELGAPTTTWPSPSARASWPPASRAPAAPRRHACARCQWPPRLCRRRNRPAHHPARPGPATTRRRIRCCRTCCAAQAASIRATPCWLPPGATTARAPTARWTPTSKPCAPSCARVDAGRD